MQAEARPVEDGATDGATDDIWIDVCAFGDVIEGEAIRVETADLVLAVFNLAGRIHVIDDACTHGPGSLSEGCIDGETVECDFHGGAFNICTGEVAAPPCMVPIRTYAVRVDGGRILVDPSQRAQP